EPPRNTVVDRPAVVGIDQAELPELAAAIEIGDAGEGQLQRRLRQAVDGAAAGDAALEEIGKSLREGVSRGDLQRTVDEAGDGLLVSEIGIAPARALLPFAHGLLHEALHALSQSLHRRGIGGVELERPGTDEALVEEVFV